jgi:hypothetical protein
MQRLELDGLQVDSFATTGEPAAQAIPTTVTVPYSMLGSCYGCPSNVTICATTEGGTV